MKAAWILLLIIGMAMSFTLHNRIAAAIQFVACAGSLVLKIVKREKHL